MTEIFENVKSFADDAADDMIKLWQYLEFFFRKTAELQMEKKN